jgi:glycerophosphoryl diester phosphodiesterase
LKKNIILIAILFMGSTITSAQTKIIAHRGFSGAAPENTLIAFQKAIDIGADYLELDIHRTKDDSIVVIHDKSVNRTSSNNLKGLVAEMTYNELNKVRVGYSKKFKDEYTNEKIPTLIEVLKLARGKIKVCIEIKVYGVEKEVLKIINELDLHDDIIIFSFHYPVLAKIRQLDKNIPTLYLIDKADKFTLDYAKIIKVNAIGVGYRTTITQEFLDSAHKNQLEVWKWTVNDENKMQQLLDLGIDGLITNYPDKAKKLLDTAHFKKQ